MASRGPDFTRFITTRAGLSRFRSSSRRLGGPSLRPAFVARRRFPFGLPPILDCRQHPPIAQQALFIRLQKLLERDRAIEIGGLLSGTRAIHQKRYRRTPGDPDRLVTTHEQPRLSQKCHALADRSLSPAAVSREVPAAVVFSDISNNNSVTLPSKRAIRAAFTRVAHNPPPTAVTAARPARCIGYATCGT